MGHYILDACALVNLHCGWGGLRELRTFGASWSIGESALSEVIYVREFDDSGELRKLTLDIPAVVASGRLNVLSIDGAAENASLVEFAMDLDDGEAQALSMALHRKFVLVTDDRPGVRVASAAHVAVPTMGTPDILMEWVKANPECRSRLPELVRRISILGPFQLRKSSPHYLWWQALLS
jgi:predicted nucleic acid-binding protein